MLPHHALNAEFPGRAPRIPSHLRRYLRALSFFDNRTIFALRNSKHRGPIREIPPSLSGNWPSS